MAEEGAVQVCVRLRPSNSRETFSQGGSVEGSELLWKTDNQTISQINGGKSFSFDRVYHANETTQTIYGDIAHSIVCSITEGYNGTIFAYGQTSSGKTYTMMGNENAPGLIPLAICNLFNVINDMQNREFLLRVSYMEIYNESVSDLLNDSKRRPLEVREDMERMIYVADLIEEVAVTYEDVIKWVKKGEKNRHYGETKMNERSSRSHTIFRVIVESRHKNNEAVMVAHLNLVDLAGSERASQTGAEGVRLKEGCNINRSLFVLGQVIKKLSDGQVGSGFVNYRDSKLTRILQNSLGGNARTLIICTISPAAFEETLSTLQFASTAKFMKNTPHVNEVLDDQAMLKRCRKEIMDLKNHLEELASETRVHELEKAQILAEKHHLKQEHEEKIKNLTKMLVRVSPEKKPLNTEARRKRRYTWAPGKLRTSLNTATDNDAKIIKLDQAFQELDEIHEEFPDDQSDTTLGCNSQITIRGRSFNYQILPFDHSSQLSDQSPLRESSCTSMWHDRSAKDEYEKRISEQEKEKEKEVLTEEREKENIQLKNNAKHFEKQLKESVELCELLYSEKFDAESLKIENEKHKEEIQELKKLLEEKQRNEKYFKMEDEKQKIKIQELEKLRDGLAELKERRDIEEFEFLEQEVVKQEKAQQKHEIAKLKQLVHNSEIFNQELEAELKAKTKQLKDQEQSRLVLQQRLDQIKEISDGQIDLETLTIQIKQLQRSLNDAEVVTCDAKKDSAFLRSENLELKEIMKEMKVNYQQMEKDVQLYCTKLDTERLRYKQMQSDLQKELKYVYSENIKLISLLDGKVPKDLLDRYYLEKNIADLNQQLGKAEKENISLHQEVAILSQEKMFPEKVDEFEKQVSKLTEELNGVTSERDDLLVGRERNVKQLESLQGEMSLIGQERDKLQEALMSLQSERDHQDNLKAEQQNEVQARLKMELELCCSQLEEERVKCLQLRHNIEDKEEKVKELEQQLMLERVNQKELDNRFSEMSEKVQILNNEKEELMTKLHILTEANDEVTMSRTRPNKDKEPLNVTTEAETTETKHLSEELVVLQKNYTEVSDEKEKLHEELLNLQTERDQLKCDLQENIEMVQKLLKIRRDHDTAGLDDQSEAFKNQAELRSLYDKLKKKQNVEMELKKSLAEKECLLNDEKEKFMQASQALDVAQEELRYEQQLVNEMKTEIHEKKDMFSIQENLPEIVDKKQKQVDELCLVAQHDALVAEIEELRACVSKQKETEIQVEEFNLRFQQLEEAKSNLLKEKYEFQETLKCIKAENYEMKRALEEKTEVTQKQDDELHHTVAQRDILLAEIEELRHGISKEQEVEICEEKFNQRFQQLENEKSSLIEERDELQEKLRCIEEEKDEMKKTLQENTKVMEKQGEDLGCMLSQRDVLLAEIEEMQARASNQPKTQIQEEKCNLMFQQLENENASILKGKDELQETVKSVKIERDEMKRILQENCETMQKQTEELCRVNFQHDVLLAEMEVLRTRVFKEQEVEINEEEFNQQFQQLEDKRSSLLKEKNELQETLKCNKAEKDEMKKVLQENSEVVQKQREELHCTLSQCDMLLADVEELRTRISKEQEVEIREEEYNQRFHQLEDEKSSLVKKKDKLQETLKCINAEKDEMIRTLQEKTNMMQKQGEELSCLVSQRDALLVEVEDLRVSASKEPKAEIQEEFNQQFQQLANEKLSIVKEKNELEEKLKSIMAERDGMKKTLQGNTEIEQNQDEELRQVASQRDMLLAETVELRIRVSKEQKAEIREEEFNQRFHQLEDEKSSLVKEMDKLQETLKCINADKDEMIRILQEKNSKMQKQGEELSCLVSQRDALLVEVEDLRVSASKEPKAEIQEKEFNQQFQQLANEKLSIVKEKNELEEKLKSIMAERDGMKKTLQGNTEIIQNQDEELRQVASQRDMLLAETEELRTRVSKEQKAEIQEDKFNQRFQQLEDEKLSIMKERNYFHESLACVKIESDEMKRALQEKMQEQAEELHQLTSQRDLLLKGIEELRTCASKEQNLQVLEEKFNLHLQQLDDEKTAIVKEKDKLLEMLERIQLQKDEMKGTLQENIDAIQVQTKELNSVISERDMLLSEIKELRVVSKDRHRNILEMGFSQQLQQLKDEKSAMVKEMAVLQEKLEHVKVERDEIKRTRKENTKEERRNKELTELVASLEKQIATLKEEQMQIESITPENQELETEIKKLSNHLEEKDLLLQETIQNLFQLEDEYKIDLDETNQQFSREGEAWNELLVKFSAKFPAESSESISIKKLQEENQKLYEQLVLWRDHFMRVLNTVPQNVKRYQIPITKCDVGLADEKKKNAELCIQLQTMKKQVSDSPLQEFISEEKNPEILRLSTLIEYKETHLKNTQQTLSDLKLKYQNYLRSTKNGLSSKTKARNLLMERISVVSCTNVWKTIQEIEHEMQTLNRDFQLKNEALQNEVTFFKSMQTGYVKYIRNSCNEMANEKKKNERLLLEIVTFRQQLFNKNGCDPLLAMENQNLKKKVTVDEQLLQEMGIKVQELENALTTSQEINKRQEDKVTHLQTELNSKTLENKLEDLQTTLSMKDTHINSLEETLKKLQCKLDVGAQPFKEEMNELKNRLFTSEMEKLKESKSLENQISTLKASLEHKEELMRETKEKLRRYQQEQDTTIVVENSNKMCSNEASLTCSAGSGIVQNALLLVLKCEKAKLHEDLNRVKKENARLVRTMSELKYENTKWKDRSLRLKEKEIASSGHQCENIPCTLTPSLEESITPCSFTECTPVSQKTEISTALFPPEVKTGAKTDETSLTSENMLPVYSSKVSSFGTESKWQLPSSKIFDNSQLGFPAAESPQRKPKSEGNERDDWWPKPSASDPQCKMQ